MIDSITKFVENFEKSHPEYVGELTIQEYCGGHVFLKNMTQFVIELLPKKAILWNYELMKMRYDNTNDCIEFNAAENRDKYTDYTDEEELSKALIKFLNWKNVTFKNYKKNLRIKAIEEL